jgi:hypothetical protein
MAVMTVCKSGQRRLLTPGRSICHKLLVILGQSPKSCMPPLLFPGVSSVVLPSSTATADVQKLSKWATLVPSHPCRFIQHALIAHLNIKSREPSLDDFHASCCRSRISSSRERRWKYVGPSTLIVHFSFRSSTNGLPACTTSFGLTKTISTTHPVIWSSDLADISSFIASRIVTIFSFSILAPSLISTLHTLALRGASIGMMPGSR